MKGWETFLCRQPSSKDRKFFFTFQIIFDVLSSPEPQFSVRVCLNCESELEAMRKAIFLAFSFSSPSYDIKRNFILTFVESDSLSLSSQSLTLELPKRCVSFKFVFLFYSLSLSLSLFFAPHKN